MWCESPQAEYFSPTDWDFLLGTALIHARLWNGEASAAAELRLRVAKFGATPEGRARLRMQFAPDVEHHELRGAESKRTARNRYVGLKVVRPDGNSVEKFH
ncbi:hypothetical protein AB0C11_41990 [Streptomyces sp. NPDC039016]|uniref:phage terminase small subunit n=1 Tax=Streptomyces sp. NPDC039016 TaxID=3154330 RepID=UPI003410C945